MLLDTLRVHAQEKIGERRGFGFDVATARESGAAGAGEDDWEIVVGVPIAVGVARAVNDHRIVEERLTIDVLRLLHLLEKLRELFYYSATTRHFPPSRGDNSASLGTSAVMAVALLAQ
jgi:hypothetical protein